MDPDNTQLLNLRKKISKATFAKIKDEFGKKLIERIKYFSPDSTFNSKIEEHNRRDFEMYLFVDLKELYVDTVLGVQNKKQLINCVLDFEYTNDDLDYYVDFVRNGLLKTYELKLFLINFNENKKNIIDDFDGKDSKFKLYELDRNYYIKIDMEKLNDNEAKIVYYVVNHKICYEDLVMAK